jgi:hypothetical protein
MDLYPSELLKLGGLSVCECSTDDEAELCNYVLSLAKIRSVVVLGRGKLDLRTPQVKVAPDDVDRARRILDKPIEEDLRREFEEQRNVGDFQFPICPACSSPDVLLESTEPENEWLCETCGRRWSDSMNSLID